MSKILVLDPGNTTGWVFYDSSQQLIEGGTIREDLKEIYNLIVAKKPTMIVYERFQLYPGKAKSMAWNTFYPVEVIGAIKLTARLIRAEIDWLKPSDKKYALNYKEHPAWKVLRLSAPFSEHMKDAFQLLMFFMRKNRLSF